MLPSTPNDKSASAAAIIEKLNQRAEERKKAKQNKQYGSTKSEVDSPAKKTDSIHQNGNTNDISVKDGKKPDKHSEEKKSKKGEKRRHEEEDESSTSSPAKKKKKKEKITVEESEESSPSPPAKKKKKKKEKLTLDQSELKTADESSPSLPSKKEKKKKRKEKETEEQLEVQTADETSPSLPSKKEKKKKKKEKETVEQLEPKKLDESSPSPPSKKSKKESVTDNQSELKTITDEVSSEEENGEDTSTKEPMALCTPAGLTEVFVEASDEEKPLMLLYLMHHLQYHRILCFTKTAETAHRLTLLLKLVGGGKKVKEVSRRFSQFRRNKIVKQFEKGKLDMIVCTEVLERVEVKDVKFVISYDHPNNVDTYIRRASRTACAGKAGKAMQFLNKKQVYHFKRETLAAGRKLGEDKIPNNLINPYRKNVEEALKIMPDLVKNKNYKKNQQPAPIKQ